jgi:guanylate kinase
MSAEKFKSHVEAGDFLEWAEVHGNCYGTLNAEIEKHTASGEDVVLELDVQGKRSIETAHPEVKTVFIMPPSLDVLEQRLRDRGGLSENDLETRLKNAEEEMAARGEYDYVVVNDELNDAVKRFNEILMELRQS